MNGSAQSGDFGEALAAQVMLEGQAQGVEGLVVVQDPLALANIGSHAPGFGAHHPGLAPLLDFFCVAGPFLDLARAGLKVRDL